ncbi:IS1096 element passenger TnpR family protein [Agromyces sp. SYSU T00194]|uniref:IS1096 element passenger TnpR family protein n=1 Tax=Agromyces chitinivorans TaxID=3158560 RepID=UPI003397CA1D
MPASDTLPRPRLTVRVELRAGDDPPWREIAIDASLGLATLADAILLAFGWTGTGSWRFGTMHTPWWGREADAWGQRILTPARPHHPAPVDEYGGYDEGCRCARCRYGDAVDWDPKVQRRVEPEWNLDHVLERFGGTLEFEYRPLDARSGTSDHTWRHRITVGVRDEATTDASAPSANLIDGAGAVPRSGTEAAFGELGDPTHRISLQHEFALRFGASDQVTQSVRAPGWEPLDVATRGAGEVARRALRMDLVELGALDPPMLDIEEVERGTAQIRALLRAAGGPDGIDAETAGELGDDLKALHLVRTQRGRMLTLVAVRDRILPEPVTLWYELARQLMSLSGADPEIAARAVDLACGGKTVRRFALEQARSAHRSGQYSSEFGPTRVDRMLLRLGLVDADGRPGHSNARAFGFAMLRGGAGSYIPAVMPR